MKFGGQNVAGRRVLNPVEKLAGDAKRRRNNAARIARVHALGQHFHCQAAAGQAAQRGRRPQPLVVAATGVQTDYEIDLSHSRCERVEIRWKVVAAAFFASLDHADAARVRDPLHLQRADGGQRREYGIAVIGAAATVQLAVLEQGIPGAEGFAPADHLRLLVQVAVQQYAAIAGAGNVEIKQRGAAGKTHDLECQAANGLLSHPRFRKPDCALDVTIDFPLRIEMRRLGRNADVLGELRDDLGVPLNRDSGEEVLGVHGESFGVVSVLRQRRSMQQRAGSAPDRRRNTGVTLPSWPVFRRGNRWVKVGWRRSVTA